MKAKDADDIVDMSAEAPAARRSEEGCNGIGRHLAHRLVHDGETVFDVPPKLSAQVRVFATGNGRKTDPVDAHSVALAALRAPGLVQLQARGGPGGDGHARRPA